MTKQQRQDLVAAGVPARLLERAVASGFDFATILGWIVKYGPVVIAVLEQLLARQQPSPTPAPRAFGAEGAILDSSAPLAAEDLVSLLQHLEEAKTQEARDAAAKADAEAAAQAALTAHQTSRAARSERLAVFLAAVQVRYGDGA